MLKWNRKLTAFVSFIPIVGCALLEPIPRPTTIEERLQMIPTQNLPLQQEVTIFWDSHHIPFIKAQTDTDAAFALGLVHAHLRLGQMETLRRISQGRISEMLGTFTIKIDHALRILNFSRVSSEVVQAMPTEERAWLESFVKGINHYQQNTTVLPYEYRFLNLKKEPWTPEEVITIGRLASTDVNWFSWFSLLSLRLTRPDWEDIWRERLSVGVSSVPSFSVSSSGRGDVNSLETFLTETGRFGSNAIVVSGERSASGGALLANDPHLGVRFPNFWLIVGISSPSYQMVGFMIPGIPFVAVGRNPWIAWGGTNARTASSDLFDVSTLSADQITERTEHIGVRWWFDKTITVRETPYGSIISDAEVIPKREGETIALRWIGQKPSDELTAMLRVNRARNWDEFSTALEGFALSPQNFVYADHQGNIGQISGFHLPLRPSTLPQDVILPLSESEAWNTILTSKDLPSIFNPPEGFVASANNKAADNSRTPLGYFFSSNDRITRMQRQLSGTQSISLADLKALQQDTYQESSVALRDALRVYVESQGLDEDSRDIWSAIDTWDGYYTVESRGALAFEAFMVRVIKALYTEEQLEPIRTANLYKKLLTDLPTFPQDLVQRTVLSALSGAVESVQKYRQWGNIHRLSLSHTFGLIPYIGSWYRYGDVATGGSNNTLLKSAHWLTDEPHQVGYGANSRYVTDLSDVDQNAFVLFGGQDGWLNSSTFLDQVQFWGEGKYITIPLRTETVEKTFPYRTVLSGGGSS